MEKRRLKYAIDVLTDDKARINRNLKDESRGNFWKRHDRKNKKILIEAIKILKRY